MKLLTHIKQKYKKLSEKIPHSWKKCRFPKALRIFLRVFYILLFLYLLIVIFAARIQGLAFFPGVSVNTLEYTSSGYSAPKLVFEDINILLEGKNINGLYINKNAKKTVYYFHGNGGDLTYFYDTLDYIATLGYNVLAVEYPGYGTSQGFPYERDIMQYTEEIYQYAKQNYGLTEENMIVWGYSIGTGVATQFSLGKNIDSLLLFAPYTSLYDMSLFYYGIVIQKLFFLPNSFVTKENIQYISAPKYIIHGTQDSIVPYFQGKEVFDVASPKKYFGEVIGGDHFNMLQNIQIQEHIPRFLEYKTTNKEEAENIKEEKMLRELDLESDSSFQKYIDPSIAFEQRGYIPEDMRTLDKTYIIDTKGDLQLRDEAAAQFEKMAEVFYQDMGEKIVVVSNYRSYAYQAGIKAGGCPDSLCAKAGHSEHQSGLAFDLWSASSESYWKSSAKLMRYYEWLSKNAHLYGFHNSYQNGIIIDKYETEPWHWRYLGTTFATYLKDNNMSFAQYHASLKKEP